MKALTGEHWRPQDRDIPRLCLEFLGAGEGEGSLRRDDMRKDIEYSRLVLDCFGDLGKKALDIFDGQRQNVEIADAVYLAPSAQELASFG
jgi:hypothetical protein